MNCELDLRAATNLDMAARMVDAFAEKARDNEAKKVAEEFRDSAKLLRERAKELGDSPAIKAWQKGESAAAKNYKPSPAKPVG
jgi:hypothetical protein